MPGIDKECEGPGATHHHACKYREEYFATIEEKLKKAVEALGFYAEPYTWCRVSADAQHMGAEPGFDFDGMYGEKARACLKELGE